MKKSSVIAAFLIFAVFTVFPSLIFAEGPKPVKLPPPQTDGGKPLMQALMHRASSREFSTEKLPMQVLSDLLWAACGINRPETEKRTAPSAKDWQEVNVYVAAEEALYLYDAKDNQLLPILEEDIRAFTGKQGFVKIAPLNLVYVADFSKIGADNTEDKIFYSAVDTGFISENVYLYCASNGLATVVRAYIDKPALEKKMGLRPDQKVILSQTVGYPK